MTILIDKRIQKRIDEGDQEEKDHDSRILEDVLQFILPDKKGIQYTFFNYIS